MSANKRETGGAQILLFGKANKRDFMPRRPVKFPRLKPWNTVQEIADYLNVKDLDTIRGWIESGELVAIQRGRVLRIAKQSLRMFIAHSKTMRETSDDRARRRAAVAICEATIKEKLRDLIQENRARHTRACEIWAALAPVIRANREDI
jgi:excisionase family DNA binding protein